MDSRAIDIFLNSLVKRERVNHPPLRRITLCNIGMSSHHCALLHPYLQENRHDLGQHRP